MATTLAAAASRRAMSLTQICAPKSSTFQSVNQIHRRGFAGAADHHGPAKVNIWSDPLSPSKWKEEHFVIASLSGWGLLIYGGFKLFSGGKGKTEEKVTEAATH